MEITVEQLQGLILEETQIKEMAQALIDSFDYDTSVDLVERVTDAFPIRPEDWEKLPRLERIIYAVRGAYILGYISAVDTINDAMRVSVADFILEAQTNSPDSLQADARPCNGREGGFRV